MCQKAAIRANQSLRFYPLALCMKQLCSTFLFENEGFQLDLVFKLQF